jgi:2-polyprenyl-3-methyl-5-hydroxy-6-metoxy-1,4-benzoquinol methylase
MIAAQRSLAKPEPSAECLVCGNEARGAPLYRGILRCEQCGYVYADIRLTDEELFALYNEQFFNDAEWSNYPSEEKCIRRNFRLRLKKLKKFVDPKRHQRLLEIGSAYGFVLDEVRDDFTGVEGIDLTSAGVRHTREKYKLPAVQADFLTHDYGSRRFDVVCLWDTIEHLRAPHSYVEKIASLTEPGALLAITTADAGSVNARLRGAKWRMIHPPTHLHYFSRTTIERLLERYGFEVIYNRHCGYYRSLDYTAYNVLMRRRRQPRLYRHLARTGLTRLGFYLNLYDIMYVIARRR